MTSLTLESGTSPKRCPRGRTRSGNEKSVPGWLRLWKGGNVRHVRSFHGSSVCSGVQTVAACAKLDPGEPTCAHGEVALVPRVQLGCDQCRYQEAGGSAPSTLTLLTRWMATNISSSNWEVQADAASPSVLVLCFFRETVKRSVDDHVDGQVTQGGTTKQVHTRRGFG